jgi:hypothetical protein
LSLFILPCSSREWLKRNITRLLPDRGDGII